MENVCLRVPNRNSDILICFVFMLRVATVLPIDSRKRLMTSLRIAVYSLDGKWENNIKMDLQEVGCGAYGLDRAGSG